MKLFGNNSKASGGGLKFNIYWLYALIFMVLIGIYYTGESTSVKEMPWTDFEGWVQKKAVSHIVVHANQGDAEAEITDAYAKQVMGKDYQPVPGAKAVITTTIPSADKFEDRVDEWRKSGVFNGKVEYIACARPVPAGKGEVALHHLHRRNRRHRPCAKHQKRIFTQR